MTPLKHRARGCSNRRSRTACRRRRTQTACSECRDRSRRPTGSAARRDTPSWRRRRRRRSGGEQNRVGAQLKVDVEKVRLDAAGASAARRCRSETRHTGTGEAQPIGVERVESRDLQAEIAGQRRQRERQHEAVVESIREAAEDERRDQQVRVPAVKDLESRLDECQRRRQARDRRNTGRNRTRTMATRLRRSSTARSAHEAVAERHAPSTGRGSRGSRRHRGWRRSRGTSSPGRRRPRSRRCRGAR